MGTMKSKERRTRLVVAMITVSLAGILAVQLALLNIAWNLKNQAFQRNVLTALSTTALDLEKDEIAEGALDVMYRFGEHERVAPLWRKIEVRRPDGNLFVADTTRVEAPDIDLDISARFGTSPSHAWSMVHTDSLFESDNLAVVVSAERAQFIHRVVDDLVIQRPRPIRERLVPARLDTLLRRNLVNVGIDLPPHFGVISQESDSLVLTSETYPSPDEERKLQQSRFRVALFPMDLAPGIYEIALHFPGERIFLLESIGPLLAASILFMGVIVLAFVLTLGTIRKQHRFAGRMADFINNMTHEFKTPISTVSLASEAIGRPDIVDRPEALQRYNHMIRDENMRMRRLVEKILQLAQLESGDFQLNLVPVDLHELARDIADTFALQIEQRGGALVLDLGADQAQLLGDPVHLGNVLTNLIDNAIKYSPSAPMVCVATISRDQRLHLSVQDQGIGIDPADQERVFERYFRCSTGDRHDVKGFGLGLSFVRLLVEAHGGNVILNSSPSHGTKVELDFPLADGAGAGAPEDEVES